MPHLTNDTHRLLAAGLVVVTLGVGRAQQPTFRSGVEVTAMDVTVVDNDGRPIADLTSDEFRVRIDGKDRRVVRADWIPLTQPVGTPRPPPSPEGYSTNAGVTRGRLILIAVDQPNIQFAGTALLRSTLHAFIDRLQSSDRIAAVALGQGGVSTPFTADREEVKKAIGRMSGDMRLPSEMSQFQMGSAEALDIAEGNTAVLARVYTRECARLPPGSPAFLPPGSSECLERLKGSAFVIATSAKNDAQQTLMSLRGLLDGLKRIAAPKTLVVVSEGFVGGDQPGIVEIGSMAAAAQTSLYVLKLDGQWQGASNQGTPGPQASAADRQMRSQGVELLASVSKGDVIDVIGTGGPAVERVEREISGYYLVGVESTPSDIDGQSHPISVQVSRAGATVRARRELANAAAAARNMPTPLDALTEAMKSPLVASGLKLLVTTESTRDADLTRVQVVIRAEVGSEYSSPTPVHVAYIVTDAKGTVVINKLGEGQLPPKEGAGSPLLFSGTTSLAPGEYVLKLAMVEGSRIGSVEHAFRTGTVEQARLAPSAPSLNTAGAIAATQPLPNEIPVRPFLREEATSNDRLLRFRQTLPADARQAFEDGVLALASADYPKAEQSFRHALSAGFAGGNTVAPLVYLGATFAAAGRDPEAVGVWQAALTDGSAFPEIYEWLVDALVRVRDFAQARSIVREAVAKWPSDGRFVSRLAALQPPQGGGR